MCIHFTFETVWCTEFDCSVSMNIYGTEQNIIPVRLGIWIHFIFCYDIQIRYVRRTGKQNAMWELVLLVYLNVLITYQQNNGLIPLQFLVILY